MTAKPKRISPKSRDREERSRAVLFALIETFIVTGRPVGSAALQREGFEELSSATIRNYLAAFEAEGLLDQEHSSAGRVPTASAFQLYAAARLETPSLSKEAQRQFEGLVRPASKEVGAFLQEAAHLVSEASGCATFCLAPRFDQDMVVRIRLMLIEPQRILCALITDFGLVTSELLTVDRSLSEADVKTLETLLQNRLEGSTPEQKPRPEWIRLVERIYAELLMRHMTRYSQVWEDDLFRCGAAQLLSFPEFSHARALSPAITLLEHPRILPSLCRNAMSHGRLCAWLSDELPLDAEEPLDCAVAVAPYSIRGLPVGAIGILGPLRLPYGQIFGLLQAAADLISGHLTRSLYQFKLSYRQSPSSRLAIEGAAGPQASKHHPDLLLEDLSYFENCDDSF